MNKMDYNDTRGLLDLALAQVAAESFLTDGSGELVVADNETLLKERLTNGPNHYLHLSEIYADGDGNATKSTTLMMEDFTNQYEVLFQQQNTTSSLSFTSAYHNHLSSF